MILLGHSLLKCALLSVFLRAFISWVKSSAHIPIKHLYWMDSGASKQGRFHTHNYV